MNNLSGKKILLIAPSYFGYETEIKLKLEEKGANVFFIKENVDYQNMLVRFGRKIRKNEIFWVDYFKEKINCFANIDFDYILGIRINYFNVEIIKYLRSIFKKAKLIMYFWDSTANMCNAVKLAEQADDVLSFDIEDCDRYGWTHRPLFFLSDYENVKKNNPCKEKEGICMVATLSEDRGNIASHIGNILDDRQIKNDFRLYMQKKLFYKRKIFNHEYKNFNRKYWITEPLQRNEIVEIFRQHGTILDISHKSQSGLTMRTIETIGAGKKLITNNKSIRNYDIYKYGNIFLYDNNDSDMIRFIKQKSYVEIPSKEYRKYSLDGWITDIFALEI